MIRFLNPGQVLQVILCAAVLVVFAAPARASESNEVVTSAEIRTTADPSSIGKSIAFFYGNNPPVNVLSQFDRLVLESDNVTAAELQALTRTGTVAYAYLSVGEVAPNRRIAGGVEADWVLGYNPAWDSKIMDLSHDGWQASLLERAGILQRAGYSGLFLDTLDSYRIAVTDTDGVDRQEQALSGFIAELARRYPGLRLIANRGFDVLDAIAPHLEAVAAESLYASWDNTKREYLPVAPEARDWLLAKLSNARRQHDLEVIVIDYLPAARRDEAREVAQQIAALDFTPWVTMPTLDAVGIGMLEVMPREILMLYDSRRNGPQEDSEVHRLLATPLEYLGYVPVYLDMASEALPSAELRGRFAGIVTWADESYRNAELSPWMMRQFDSGVPVAMFGEPGVAVDSTMALRMGVKINAGLDFHSIRVRLRDALVGFERDLLPRLDGLAFSARSVASTNRVHLGFVDADGKQADTVVTGDWGGYAVSPTVITVDLDDIVYWHIDPFAFLTQALQLPSLPVPDVTSENGNRLWLAHIDGDALPSWAEMPGKKLGAEILYEQILQRYPLPHTVSIVEGEMTGMADYDDRRPRMFNIARELFALPYVEVASHTYSHPFHWQQVAQQGQAGENNLPIMNYVYSSQREVQGSVDFINNELAPVSKPTTMFLWSGNALPGADALAAARQLGLVSMNGGNTRITRDRAALSLVSPMARTVGKELQVYAPIMNENVFTNDWTGPFDGFRHVIETLEMTDQPRRLKPLNIYYHFYAGTKIAGLRSLREVYDWSLTQEINPVRASDYAKKVPAFRSAGVARYLDGQWKISGLGDIRSLRLTGKGTWPELIAAEGLAGVRQLHDGVYLHTDGADTVKFRTIGQPPQSWHLVAANGRIVSWDANGSGLRFRIEAHLPVVVDFGGELNPGCIIQSGDTTLRATVTEQNTLRFHFSDRDTGNAVFTCPA